MSDIDANDNFSLPWIRIKAVQVDRRTQGECLILKTTGDVEFAFKIEDENLRVFSDLTIHTWKFALMSPEFGVKCLHGHERIEFEAERFERAGSFIGRRQDSTESQPRNNLSIAEISFNMKEQHYGKMPQD